jgi:hypothetical protein
MLDRNDAWIDQLQAVEVAPDLILAAYAGEGGAALDVAALDVLVQRIVEPGVHVRRVMYREVAAGWPGSPEGAHDRLGDTVVVFSRVADMGQNARDTGIHSHASPGSRKPELRLTT